MELIDSLTVWHQGTARSIMLFVGDLASLPASEAVDVLVVSAFPDDYVPTHSSLIGALNRVGLSVDVLAKDKEVDLRQFSRCWLSRPIERPDIHFQRLLCFEPRHRGKAPEVVGDIFRSIVPFTAGSPPISQLAMPLLASGDQGESASAMLEALVDASVHWLSIGLPLDRIKIVIRDRAKSELLSETFSKVKQRHTKMTSDSRHSSFQFDLFVSYCHKNRGEVDQIVREIQDHRPGLRIFVDRLNLNPGDCWQQHIFDSLDQSKKVLCVFSPDYLASRVCKEEFNIALFRHRESADGVLLPLYLYSANLPTYMKLIQYEDAREGDRIKLAQSAEKLLKQL